LNLERFDDEIKLLHKLVKHKSRLERENELLGIIAINTFKVLDTRISDHEFKTLYPDELSEIKKAFNLLKEIN